MHYIYSENLRLGHLYGNQFEIVLRAVTGIDKQGLVTACEGVKNNGFINYFGLQRYAV